VRAARGSGRQTASARVLCPRLHRARAGARQTHRARQAQDRGLRDRVPAPGRGRTAHSSAVSASDATNESSPVLCCAEQLFNTAGRRGPTSNTASNCPWASGARLSEQRALVAATVEVPRGELFLMKSTCVQLAETCRLAVRRGGFSHPEMSTLPEDSASAPQSGRRTPGWGSIMARRSSSASYPCASVIFPARKVIPHIG
jgi:hypothetical protein